ncbi:hypothetical protein [Chitinophaga silvatica]|nr:hypothetical protein [Chitinophaga silvatica]
MSIEENSERYKMQISYNSDKTPLVEHYLDSCFQPVKLFEGTHKINREIMMDPETKFNISAAKGRLSLIVLKSGSNTPALDKCKDIANGVKQLICAPIVSK